jgi:hypothetical protein
MTRVRSRLGFWISVLWPTAILTAIALVEEAGRRWD